MAIEIVDFPINSMVIFPSAMLNYQRVPTNKMGWISNKYVMVLFIVTFM